MTRFKNLTKFQQQLLTKLPDDPAQALLCQYGWLRTARRLVELGLARSTPLHGDRRLDGSKDSAFFYRSVDGKRLCKPALEVGRHYTASVTTARIVRNGKLKITVTLDTGESFNWFVSPHGDK